MSNIEKQPTPLSGRALEMVMRDVLDGLLETSLRSAYCESADDFEIIDIAPAQSKHHPKPKNESEETEIIPFPQKRRAVG